MIILDGKKIAENLISELKLEVFKKKKEFRLAVIRVGEDPATDSFLKIKKMTGEKAGIGVKIFSYDKNITADKLRKEISGIVHDKKNTAVIIQLPLPANINVQYILNSVTAEKDADVLSARSLGNFIVGKSPILPPVVGAINKFFEEYNIEYRFKNILIIGAGRLVGRPMAAWLLSQRVGFSIVTKKTPNFQDHISAADIIISGAGQAKLIIGDIVKKGAVIMDAGLSELDGKMVGDVDFDSVSRKVSYITPVPGGIGPLAVAMLFYNVVRLDDLKSG